MSTPRLETNFREFQRTLRDCRSLYVDSGRLCETQHPELIPRPPGGFVQLMDDLHRGLLIKTYVTIAEADRTWSAAERRLAQELFDHVWGRRLEGEQLREAMLKVSEHAVELKWYSLVRPFTQIEPLRDRIGQLETVVVRLANLVAKADGQLSHSEVCIVRALQDELDHHLHAIPFDSTDHEITQQRGNEAVSQLRDEIGEVRNKCALDNTQVAPVDTPGRPSLNEAVSRLERLIGMAAVKNEVRSLANFIVLQERRAEAGLPRVHLGLHMVFAGNPGTGKTTVARIVGQILGAIGVLSKGHVVETDRSGLVAEYAGQTGPKTNRKIDEALNGILFVDEAYSLIAESNDPYGHEAVQTLLKRMEDDRDRLVVILAGYPEPIEQLLRSNPGLSSRFGRRIHFDDYGPLELAQIMQLLCDTNRYKLPGPVRAKLLAGLTWLHEQRDEHFGNGRLVRNIFEDAIRRLANRVADVTPITTELLTRLHPADIHPPGVPADVWQRLGEYRYRVECPGCRQPRAVPGTFLGRHVQCSCGHHFVAQWGEVVTRDAS